MNSPLLRLIEFSESQYRHAKPGTDRKSAEMTVSMFTIRPIRNCCRDRRPLRFPGSPVLISGIVRCAILLCSIHGTCVADSFGRDESARGVVFSEEYVSENVHAVHRAARSMGPAERYRYLRNWVLPGREHDSFRLSMDFGRQHSPPIILMNGPTPATQPSVNSGLISPAIDLVAAATEVELLPELRSSVEAVSAAARYSGRCRLTLLVMVDIAAKQFEAAERRLADLHSMYREVPHDQLAIRCPETLAVLAGLGQPETREAAQELLSYIFESFVRTKRMGGKDPWDRLIFALAGTAKAARNNLDDLAGDLPGLTLKHWSPVSRTTARSRGAGFPQGAWQVSRGMVWNLATHNEDYLYLRTPLRGDFEVECDVTLDGFQHSHLAVAGTWVAPVWRMSSVETGIFRLSYPRIEFNPRLSQADEWIRYRTVVRDGTLTTFLNGRRVYSSQLPPDHEPWVAIRSPWYASGAVRDLRITGQPSIPAELHLARLPDLAGWAPYFDERMGRDWVHVRDAESGDQILGNVRDQVLDSGLESLLQYNRPMLEDGVIEYDFFYDEGTAHVHPALDRLAFLLLPQGVRLHRLTDGLYETAPIDPLNVADESTSRRGPSQLPLHQNAWNHLALTLSGEMVELRLNGQLVFERHVETDSQLNFGLFHYADQTVARVRNITWKGHWRELLQGLERQELALPQPEYLRLALPMTFRHDFARDGLPTHLFSPFNFSGDERNLDVIPAGVKFSCAGQREFLQCGVAANLEVQGDFDITASFDLLIADVAENGSGGMSLELVFDDDDMTESEIYRGFVRQKGQADRQIVQLHFARKPVAGVRQTFLGTFSEESNAGRLRLIRHGKMLHCLIAEGDSPNFRHVSSEKVGTANLTPDGIRLMAATMGASRASVVLKDLVVRAEFLHGPAVDDTVANLDRLNKLRDNLSSQFRLDFTRQPPTFDQLYRWNDRRPWDDRYGGLRINAPGSNRYVTAGFNVRRTVSGDFDIQARFDVVDLPTPAPGKYSTAYFQVELPDKDRTWVSLIFRMDESKQTVVIAERRVRTENGRYRYQSLSTVNVESVSGFRFARHNGRISCIVSSKDFPRDRIIATVKLPDLPIQSSNVRFLVHAGGAGRESKVLAKLIEIRANEVTPETVLRSVD